MQTIAAVGVHLRQARELAGFNQQDSADAAGVAREMISYWENDRRIPSYAQLVRLAEVYGSSVEFLLGAEAEPEAAAEHGLFSVGFAAQSPPAKAAVRRWLAFLDDWADLLAECGDPLPGRQSAPKRAWRAAQAITDSRLAPRLAADVRQHYALGDAALPGLLAFLDRQGVLVYRVALDPFDDVEGVSGMFYNHPRLGYTMLVNTCTTLGRQTFTLAHEFAHALFHYQERGLVSRARDRDRKERFADAFASHFLVPGATLRELTAPHRGNVVSPFAVLRLHRDFRVSYATMLNRLCGEGLLSPALYDVYRGYSPRALAKRLGLDDAEYAPPRWVRGVTLGTYPLSVLERVRQLVEAEELSPAAAADLLHVSQEEILADLLAAIPPATAAEQREFTELPEPAIARARQGVAAVW